MRRVVVTGLGVVTPIGNTVQDFWKNLCAGHSGVQVITRFDTSRLRTHIAAEVHDIIQLEGLNAKQIKRMERFICFALFASQRAWQDANLPFPCPNPYEFGVIIGSTHGGEDAVLKEIEKVLYGNPQGISPWLIPRMLVNMASAQVAIHFGLHGPNFAIVSACATGTHSIGEAAEIIRRGDALVMVCGGAESCITPLTLAGDQAALSRKNETPKEASRPFDSNRDGFVLGEGACVLVLEEHSYALSRGASIYAELTGYGATSDAFHVTAPEPTGVHLASAIQRALVKAQLLPNQVSAIFAHATGTKIGDIAEGHALQLAFGDELTSTPLTAIKSTLGHLFGASGAVQAVAAIKAIHEQVIPPTINLSDIDPEFTDFNFVRDHAQAISLAHVLSLSSGFGGHNAVLLFSKNS